MFLANLSAAILMLCEIRHLSYEAAAELCGLSARYFGDIARGKTAPTILTLEKLCTGFSLTPNELLLPSPAWLEKAFRSPMPVALPSDPSAAESRPVCPRCKAALEAFQSYCNRCGQCLSWKRFSKVKAIL